MTSRERREAVRRYRADVKAFRDCARIAPTWDEARRYEKMARSRERWLCILERKRA